MKTTLANIAWFCIIFLLLKCKSNSSPLLIPVETFECELKLDSGFNSIILGIDTFKDIENILGPGIKKTEIYPIGGLEFNLLPNFKNQLHYPHLGIAFANNGRGFIPFLFSKKIAIDMFMSSECICKTKDGIGIGTSKSIVKKILDKEISCGNRLKFNSSCVLGESYIEFQFNTLKEEKEPTIDSIWIQRHVNK